MDKRQRNILGWILTWAGLLVGILYSPIGSPELYQSQNFYKEYQGVNFSGAIENAPIVSSSNQNYGQDLSVPDYNGAENNTATYAVTTATTTYDVKPETSASQSANYSVSTKNNDASPATGTSGISGGNSSANQGSKKTDDAQSYGFNTMKSNTSMLAGNQTESFGYVDKSGGADPGSYDPTGNPLPVSDAWGFLLILAVGYGVWKMKKKTVAGSL